MTMATLGTSQQEIEFRKKTEKNFPEDLKPYLMKAVRHVNSLSRNNALKFLWHMTSQPELALKDLNLTCIEKLADCDDIPFDGPKLISKDLIIDFRNELRYQRTLIDKDFGKNSVSDGLYDAFHEFYNAMSQDDIVTSIVLNTCHKTIANHDNDYVESAIILLKNSEEKNRFGGLRRLHFDYPEAVYLFEYAYKIGDLLSAMYEEKRELERQNSPFACLSGKYSNSEPEENLETEPTVPENTDDNEHQESSGTVGVEVKLLTPNTLTTQTIIEHSDVLDTFLQAYNSLKASGLDPDEVISKIDYITKLLEVYKVLG